jgi:hypothetical protein
MESKQMAGRRFGEEGKNREKSGTWTGRIIRKGPIGYCEKEAWLTIRRQRRGRFPQTGKGVS